MADLGVHLETCTNEASAAAMLGASINYPLRGAVTWKSIVGTNVAADALSNLASPGVIGGAMIILGEDYGEGASVIQERSYAYAMKSSMWLLDPRPDLPTIVRCVEEGFELSEASHAPGDAGAAHPRLPCHRRVRRQGQPAGAHSASTASPGPPRFDYARLAHPPVTFVQERLKVEEPLPAAQELHPRAQAQRGVPRRSRRHRHHRHGRAHQRRAARARAAGPRRYLRRLARPDLVLNVVYPLVPEELRAFCAGKRAVLVVEEGHPDYIEQAINVELRRADIQTRVLGKGRCRRPANTPPKCCSTALPRSSPKRAPRASTPTRSPRSVRGIRRRMRRGGRGARRTCRRARRRSAPAARNGRCSARIKLVAARDRPDPYQRRYRLPLVRDLAAVQHRQLDPRLRHVARERRRGRPQHGPSAPSR